MAPGTRPRGRRLPGVLLPSSEGTLRRVKFALRAKLRNAPNLRGQSADPAPRLCSPQPWVCRPPLFGSCGLPGPTPNYTPNLPVHETASSGGQIRAPDPASHNSGMVVHGATIFVWQPCVFAVIVACAPTLEILFGKIFARAGCVFATNNFGTRGAPKLAYETLLKLS